MPRIFNNKIVAISGGMGDIGRALCRAFAREGAAIALCDVVPHALGDDFASQVKQDNQVLCTYDSVDVTDAAAIEEWFDRTIMRFGVPDIIIANAATVTLGGILGTSPDVWAQEISVNLNGAFYLTQTGARHLMDSKKTGHIVFVGSWAAHAPQPRMPAYCAAKAGLRILCKCMALELAPHGILVNEIAPGYVDGGLSGQVWKQRPDLAELAKKQVPTGHIIQVDDIAAEALHLCRPENIHTTGSTLLMDGGLSLRS